jgi:hypothetical protein
LAVIGLVNFAADVHLSEAVDAMRTALGYLQEVIARTPLRARPSKACAAASTRAGKSRSARDAVTEAQIVYVNVGKDRKPTPIQPQLRDM